MPSLPSNHFEGADSISFGQQPIRQLQIAMYVNEYDDGPDGSLAVSLLVADSSCCSLSSYRLVTDQTSTHTQLGRRNVRSCSVHSLWTGCGWPTTFLPQGELGAEEGEVKGCSTKPAWEGVGGVLWAGTAATPAPQRQLQPGQGLDNEAHHQLPAHEKTAQHWSVSVVVVPVSGQLSLVLNLYFFSGLTVIITFSLYCQRQLENGLFW